MKGRFRDQRGYTMVELLVGLLVGTIVLFAVADLEITAWRNRRAEEQRFTQRAEAVLAADQIVARVREARVLTVPGSPAVEVTIHPGAGVPVTYRFDQAAGTLIRSDGRILASGVASAAFAAVDGGRTLRLTLQMQEGYTLRTQATLRSVP